MARPSTIPFALVDVFTESPLTGNPLAVVPVAADLQDRVLAQLAREFNLSETTFLYSPTVPNADWKLRSFTPSGVEVFGAGHNALGAWWWLAAAGRLVLREPVSRFHQQLGQAVLPVSIQVRSGQPQAIGMHQEAPTFGEIANANELTAALGLTPADLALDLPAQVVSTGVAHLLVPVRRSALERVSPQPALPTFVQSLGGEGCYVFTLDTQDPSAVAEARFFSPGVGIPEDPATGTAAGPLAAYLIHYARTTGPEVLIHQGASTGRPSRLRITVVGDQVELWGAAVVTAEGTIRIPDRSVAD